jgi:nitrite reductase/ring-hydroxylating ferredoxin subunit
LRRNLAGAAAPKAGGEKFIMSDVNELNVICLASDINEDQAFGFVLMREEDNGERVPWPILIARRNNNYYGYENACPHEGTKLDQTEGKFLDEDGNFITCGTHGARFHVETGNCFVGPCRGQNLKPIKVVIDDGDVCITGVKLIEEE